MPMRLMLALMSLFVGLGVSHVDAETRRPNVVFILADDLGWSDTTLHGTTKLYQTPNIERLAKRGMLFTQAYSASPLCSPTRSAILTGLSPARTGITTPSCHLPQVVLAATTSESGPPDSKATQPNTVTRLKVEYPTLAKSLKAAGYATGHFGKWHLGSEPYSPLEHGFDVDVPHHSGPGPAGSYVAPWKFKDFDHDPDQPNEHIEDRMAKEAVAWMERHKDEPFYLNYWMFSVHAPFDAKQSLVDKYKGLVNPKEAQRSPTYAAMIESMDDAVGSLLDAIDRLGIADNTIVVFTADNGGNMYNEIDGTTPTNNAPLRGGKASMFEGGTRVPCVVVWPNVVEAGTTSDVLVQSEDYYPTFLDGLGLPAADDQVFDGVTIMPALRGGTVERDGVFQYFPHSPPVPQWLPPSVSVHHGDWKLIRIFHGGENGEHRYKLFNLAEDIRESRNLADSMPERVRELDAKIEAFLVRTHAVRPLPNPKFDPSKYRLDDEGKPRAKTKGPREASNASRGKDPGDDPRLGGWKIRNGKVTVKKGIVVMQPSSDEPFLGFAAGKLAAGASLRFRVKSDAMDGKVTWMPQGKVENAIAAAYKTTAGEWMEIKVKVPGPLDQSGILRLYLPSSGGAIEIDWIELESDGAKRRFEF